MGFVTESQIRQQAKKGQGETNDRLDRIADLLEQQNAILEQLAAALSHRA